MRVIAPVLFLIASVVVLLARPYSRVETYAGNVVRSDFAGWSLPRATGSEPGYPDNVSVTYEIHWPLMLLQFAIALLLAYVVGVWSRRADGE